MNYVHAWMCSHCNMISLYKANVQRHEKSCPSNPANKACKTCIHSFEDSETIYNPHHGGNPGSTDEELKFWGCKVDLVTPNIHCEGWELWIPKSFTATIAEVIP